MELWTEVRHRVLTGKLSQQPLAGNTLWVGGH